MGKGREMGTSVIMPIIRIKLKKREYQEQKYGSLRQHDVVKETKAVQSTLYSPTENECRPQLQATDILSNSLVTTLKSRKVKSTLNSISSHISDFNM